MIKYLRRGRNWGRTINHEEAFEIADPYWLDEMEMTEQAIISEIRHCGSLAIGLGGETEKRTPQ